MEGTMSQGIQEFLKKLSEACTWQSTRKCGLSPTTARKQIVPIAEI
jgi:hypothetical protein